MRSPFHHRGQPPRVTAIHRVLIRTCGFDGSCSPVSRFVRSLGLSKPEATVHLDFSPGEAAQVDFGAGPMIPDPENLPIQQPKVPKQSDSCNGLRPGRLR